MASPDDLIQLYGELRASLLSRHFALGRYFRANFLSLRNHLGYLHGSESGPQTNADDVPLPCGASIVRPSTYVDVPSLGALPYTTASANQASQLVERWRIAWHERENPLMFSGKLMICLAVEYALGNTESLEVLRQALKSFATLYKFSGNSFDGYIIRWDPVTSDRWSTISVNNAVALNYRCEFLIVKDAAGNYSYSYCTPFDNPAYDPRSVDQGGDQNRHQTYRAWEPSQDELVGLMMGYDIAYRLVPVNDVQDEIRRQVNNLGDYLAEYSYLLVRPKGGFTARGASLLLPAFEFPFGRVFARITGQPYSARNSFENALGKAGLWDQLKDPLFFASVGGVAASIVLGYLLSFFAAGFVALVVALLGIGAFVILARAWVLYVYRKVFDVWSDNERTGFAAAYLLLKLAVRARFTLWLSVTAQFFKFTGRQWSMAFPPYLGLTGLDDSDATVRDA